MNGKKTKKKEREQASMDTRSLEFVAYNFDRSWAFVDEITEENNNIPIHEFQSTTQNKQMRQEYTY